FDPLPHTDHVAVGQRTRAKLHRIHAAGQHFIDLIEPRIDIFRFGRDRVKRHVFEIEPTRFFIHVSLKYPFLLGTNETARPLTSPPLAEKKLCCTLRARAPLLARAANSPRQRLSLNGAPVPSSLVRRRRPFDAPLPAFCMPRRSAHATDAAARATGRR